MTRLLETSPRGAVTDMGISSLNLQENRLRYYFPEYERVNTIVRNGFDTVIFDFESTLTGIEAFDVWGKMLGLQQDLQTITNNAQDGKLPFDKALPSRLYMAEPNTEMVHTVGQKYQENFTSGIFELLEILQASGINVMVMSGGFHETMKGSKKMLRVQVFANNLYHDTHGRFIGYSDQYILAQDGGKDQLIRQLKEQGIIQGKVALVGDGEPDMKTGDADLKIGFLGWVQRPEVSTMADVLVNRLSVLAPILVGERRWHDVSRSKDAVLSEYFTIGTENIQNDRGVYFRNFYYGRKLKNRLNFYTDYTRDLDVVHLL